MGAVYVVRHGQASFGAVDYDVLSPQGVRQAELLGTFMQGRGIEPTTYVSGALRRQRETALHLARAAGWPVAPTVDPRWDEFRLGPEDDSLGVSGQTDSQAYQADLETRMRHWERDGGGSETLAAFTERVLSALADLAASLGSGEDAVVVTSAGVISMVAGSLLAGGVEQWILLNRVCVNTGVTTVAGGRRGLSLLSFNEHGHLGRADITYR